MSGPEEIPADVASPAASPEAIEPQFDTEVEWLVALGASAGGLDALDRFFSTLPDCPKTAFVVVLHLSPDHKSMMDEILSRHTKMQVQVATDGVTLLPRHVYVIPPGKTLTLEPEHRLKLLPKPQAGLSLPIDAFFASMAREFHDAAVAIVLSGTGSDGSRGILPVSELGGLVLVQEPASAKFDGMPVSAIQTGVVDRVMAPEELATVVADCVRDGKRSTEPWDARATDSGMTPLASLFAKLEQASQIDFREYKSGTIVRRIERRMHARKCAGLSEYVQYVESTPGELVELRRELLIPVSGFMRDTEAFERLRQDVIRPLVKARVEGLRDPIRVWVTACARGEEAYSIAILIEEAISDARASIDYKIFATDVSTEYIEVAAQGRFSSDAFGSLAEDVRARYFESLDNGFFQVRPALRQRVVFARHNLLVDPPFTNMDLVTCRNMLIYLRPSAQNTVLQRLEYALKVGGALFLGSSESLVEGADRFSVIDSRSKLFRLARRVPLMPILGAPAASRVRGTRDAAAHALPVPNFLEQATASLMAHYCPPSLVVTPKRELVHIIGDARSYLHMAAGQVSLDIVELMPESGGLAAAAMVARVSRSGEPQKSTASLVTTSGTVLNVLLTGLPVISGDQVTHVLLSIEATKDKSVAAQEVDKIDVADATRARILELEEELQHAKTHLQESLADLGAANEELQATNEEMVAANEELQSTNEELQSVNEELHTVNTEFQEKIESLDAVNADLESLIRAIRTPTVFVDHRLVVQRYTPQAASVFRLREGDVGRPLEDVNHILEYPGLFDDVRTALTTGEYMKREVEAQGGRRFIADVLPYRVRPGEGNRAVLTFVDISETRDASRLQGVLDALPANVAVIGANGQIQLVNRSWREFAARNGDPALRHTGVGQDYLAVLRRAAAVDGYAKRALDAINSVMARTLDSHVMVYPCHSPTEKRWFLLHTTQLGSELGACVVSHLNVTSWLDPQAMGIDEAAEDAP